MIVIIKCYLNFVFLFKVQYKYMIFYILVDYENIYFFKLSICQIKCINV